MNVWSRRALGGGPYISGPEGSFTFLSNICCNPGVALGRLVKKTKF